MADKFGGIPVTEPAGDTFGGVPVEAEASPEQEPLGFSEGFDLGGGSASGFVDRLKESNLGVRGGQLLMEDTFRRAGFGSMVEEADRGDKFEKWQPLIWDAEDQMNAIEKPQRGFGKGGFVVISVQ